MVRYSRVRAVRMLALATVLWGLSFPIVKGLSTLFEALAPGASSWFHASLMGVVRFGCAGVVLLTLSLRTLRRLTRLELWEGIGLGFFAGGGILFQMDGLAHTNASTSAFLTQCFCVLVPVIVAIRDRAAPGARVVIAILMIMSGVAVLSNFDPKTFRLGRGELETLVSACFFAGQIVWLERPLFKDNDVNRFSLVMFFVMAGMSLPIIILTAPSATTAFTLYQNSSVLVLTAALTIFCTIGAYVMMNKWQPQVPANEASIIYGAEPLIASAFALFLPGLISRAAGINYANEQITQNLVIGGALIVAANLVLQMKPKLTASLGEGSVPER